MRRIPLQFQEGQRFGRLVVVRQSESKHGETQWECRCDCGETKIAKGGALSKGGTKSCGCLKRENGRVQGQKRAKELPMSRQMRYVKDLASNRIFAVFIDKIGRVVLRDVENPAQPPLLIRLVDLFVEERFREVASTKT